MDDHLDICTLGGLNVLRSGTPITDFDQRKVPAMLVYLACNPRPQSREVLAELFWEDRTQSQSLANLRVALSNLRKLVDPFVDIDRETVRMAGNGTWRLDAVTFEDCLADAGDDLSQLEDALSLYQGDFLEGFFIDSQGFEDWALLERERLRFRAMEALDRLIDCHLGQRDYAGGISAATRLLQLDSLREKTHRQLMQLLALSGERGAALAQYETCCRVLETEFGVQPAVETVNLFEHIRAGQPLAEPAGPAPCIEPEPTPDVAWQRARHNLPVQSTSFVGREPEIAAIIEQLAEPDCRLLTLVGPGGMGKTRLALAVAERLVDDFADGVFFVPLAPLPSEEDIAAAVIMALPWRPCADSSASESHHRCETEAQQLLDTLRDRHLLLVLDNFEHLLDGAVFVDRILAVAPGIVVLATSREPLNLGWEWLYEVRGLLHPSSCEAGTLEDYSAIRLFVERARRVQPGFRLDGEREHVVYICELVEGMPLGIEIAAAWLRMMPCEAIAGELLDLESLQRHAPERHASLRALFEQTWQHLAPQEQEVLMKLSVFRGGFTCEAAEVVAQTTLPRMAALVNKSLLQHDPLTGRYAVHELLRQDMAGRLAAWPALRDRSLGHHAAFYANLLGQREMEVRGLEDLPHEVLIERANLRAAWDWAVAQHDLDVMRRAMRSLFWLHGQLGEEDAARVLFGRAVATLSDVLASSTERDCVLGQLLAMQSVFTDDLHLKRELAERGLALLQQAGKVEELAFAQRLCWLAFGADRPLAWEMLETSLTTYTELGDTWGMAWCLVGMCAYCENLTLDFPAATRYAQEAGNLFSRCGADRWVGRSLIMQGESAIALSDYEQARQCYQEALALSDEFGSPKMKSGALNNMAYVALYSGDRQEAERLAEEAVTIQRELGHSVDLCGVLDTLGDVKGAGGNFLAAKELFEECLAIINQMPAVSRRAVAYRHKQMGWAFSGLGEVVEAQQHFLAALRLGFEFHDSELMVNILVDVASFQAHQGQQDRALALLGITLTHPAGNNHFLDEARLRAELEAEFGPDAVAEAIERGRDRDVFEVAREVLAELERDEATRACDAQFNLPRYKGH